MNDTLDIEARQVFTTLALMALTATGILALGELFLSRHEVHMIVAGLGIGAVATIASLFVPR